MVSKVSLHLVKYGEAQRRLAAFIQQEEANLYEFVSDPVTASLGIRFAPRLDEKLSAKLADLLLSYVDDQHFGLVSDEEYRAALRLFGEEYLNKQGSALAYARHSYLEMWKVYKNSEKALSSPAYQQAIKTSDIVPNQFISHINQLFTKKLLGNNRLIQSLGSECSKIQTSFGTVLPIRTKLGQCVKEGRCLGLTFTERLRYLAETQYPTAYAHVVDYHPSDLASAESISIRTMEITRPEHSAVLVNLANMASSIYFSTQDPEQWLQLPRVYFDFFIPTEGPPVIRAYWEIGAGIYSYDSQKDIVLTAKLLDRGLHFGEALLEKEQGLLPLPAINFGRILPVSREGRKAVFYESVDLNGKLKETGKPIMLYFWADWCKGCKTKMPVASQLAKKEGLPFYTIPTDHKLEESHRLLATQYPVLRATEVFSAQDGTEELVGGGSYLFSYVRREVGEPLEYFPLLVKVYPDGKIERMPL